MSRQCRENSFAFNGLRHLGDSGNGGTTLEFFSPFLWRAPPLEMRPNSGNSFPSTQGKDPSSRARRRKRGSSGCGRDSRASSRVVAALSRFHSRGSRDLWLSLEAFPRGFPTGLSHVPPWCESIIGLKVEAVQGKQVFLEWTETSGGLWEWWHDP